VTRDVSTSYKHTQTLHPNSRILEQPDREGIMDLGESIFNPLCLLFWLDGKKTTSSFGRTMIFVCMGHIGCQHFVVQSVTSRRNLKADQLRALKTQLIVGKF
jgi:hypothetical protein